MKLCARLLPPCFVALQFLANGAASPTAAQPVARFDADSGCLGLTNGRLALVIKTRPGINPCELRDLVSGQPLADRDYAWSGDSAPTLLASPLITDAPDGGRRVALQGRLGPLNVELVFTAPAHEPGVLDETITIANPSASPVDTTAFKCGFTKCLRQADTWTPDTADLRFSPVPYRRETDGQLQEFPLREVAEHGMTFAGWAESPTRTPIWGAEGWVWSRSPQPAGATTLLLAKYNPDSMEWSLMEPLKRGTETLVRFGGAGQWKHGHPEASTRLPPGGSCRFGSTRLQVLAGDWKQAYYAYRHHLDTRGNHPPKDYNPPVHWNELYDNEYFFKAGAVLDDRKVWYTPGFDAQNKKLLSQFYSKDLILAEAAKAKALGCEALYLDPGWDTGPSHHLWDTARLGTLDSFLHTMQVDYGLKVSLWIGLGGVPPTYADPQACPPAARVVDRDGKPTPVHCFASPAFLDTKEQRLRELCRQGVAFMMFDSTQFSGPCYDQTHGHRVPSTREEHAAALIELARRLKTRYPQLLIEMHDLVTGPGSLHYAPTYFGYARPSSFDCLWGHEFMWNSMDDLLSRRAVSLYYFDLAYSIPLYLHVGLKPDNENALVFWWFASTCRHLGMGGKSPNPAVWAVHQRAMQTYLAAKRFYTQGVFYGLDELTHAHTLPDLQQSLINAFNLTNQPLQRTLRFKLADIGLPSAALQVDGASFRQTGDDITVDLTIPARGHQLLKLRTTAPNQ
jgi:hypothetical protein